MASAKQKASPTRYKCLSTLTLGGNEIRFVGFNEKNNGVHFPPNVNHCPGRLLFLAADVMCASKTSRKNFTRVITRFSKLGFAIKMRLTGFKIDGINNGGVIWFFSVQGLFRVAFDLGNMAFQKDCLSELQDVWLKRYDDPLLPADGILRFNKCLRVVPEDCMVSGVNHPQNLQREIEARALTGRTCLSRCILLPDENNVNAEGFIDKDDRIISNAKVCSCKDSCPCGPRYEMEETDPCGNVCNHAGDSVNGSDSDRNETDMEYSNTNAVDDLKNRKCFYTNEFRRKLKHLIHTMHVEQVTNSFMQQIMLVSEYLDYFASLEETDSFEKFGCILFRIMEEFLELVRTDKEMPDVLKNTFGMPRDKFIILYLVSEWLGSEFHDLEEVIKDKVETFKKENITCIDTLPSAETIIKTLFPSFMKTFVMNWLGFENEDQILGRKSETIIMSDHCYNQLPKNEQKTEMLENINYQLVQLILEFGSNCLISGIGHVVFSRLQIENNA